jgi:hypothetical protein
MEKSLYDNKIIIELFDIADFGFSISDFIIKN